MIILGIETSCDETSCAVLIGDEIKSNVVSSQVFHSQYGGVIPELASRAHIKLIVPIAKEALKKANITKKNIEAIAVTQSPGLMGALLVGVNFAKALSFSFDIPLVAVNHLEGHIYSIFLEKEKPSFPFICLIVSGGHTQIILVENFFQHKILGETLDDACGESFDKVAKILSLPYPGGPSIDKFAKFGNPKAIHFPKPIIPNTFNFSFSGIKTSVLYYLRDNNLILNEKKTIEESLLKDICASFQSTVVDALILQTISAAKKNGVNDIAIVGGVSANSHLRKQMLEVSQKNNLKLHIPKLEYSTDNAAMIAYVGKLKVENKIFSNLNLVPKPNL